MTLTEAIAIARDELVLLHAADGDESGFEVTFGPVEDDGDGVFVVRYFYESGEAAAHVLLSDLVPMHPERQRSAEEVLRDIVGRVRSAAREATPW